MQPLGFSVPVDLRWCIHPMLRKVGVNNTSSLKLDGGLKLGLGQDWPALCQSGNGLV